MKNTIKISVLVGALAGIAGSLVMQAIQPSSAADQTAQVSSALTPGANDDADAVAQELSALRRQNEELAMRLAAIESRNASSGREAVSTASSEEFAELQQEMADLAAALKDPQSAQAAGLRLTVRTAMDQIREEQSEERQQSREEREITRIDERLTELQSKLGLDQVQMQSMRGVLLSESTKRSEMWQGMRDGGMDRTKMRTAMTDLRDETQDALGNILTPLQLEDYQEIESQNRFGGFGGGRGGRGGGGGGRQSAD